MGRLRSKKHSRVLQLGSKGEDVQTLQQRLAELGYDTGGVDGQFGYLTQDAVVALQQDFGLHADGVVGKRVRSLLADDQLLARRKVYVLRPGETLADAAGALGVTLAALRYMNRLSNKAQGYAGQRLVCRSHYCLAALRAEKRAGAGLRTARKWAKTLSGVSVPAVTVTASGINVNGVSSAVKGVADEAGLDLWLMVAPEGQVMATDGAEAALAGLLAHKRRQREALETIEELARNEGAGVWLDLAALSWGNGGRLLRFVRALRATCKKSSIPLMISLPLPDSRAWWSYWLTDLDYEHLAAEADRVVLAAHSPGVLFDFAQLRRRVEMVLRLISPWKALLGISLRCEERDNSGRLLGLKPYSAGLTESYLAGVRPSWDEENKQLHAPLSEKSLWFPGKDGVMARVELVERLHLGGVALWPVGEEDSRLWPVLPSRLRAEGH